MKPMRSNLLKGLGEPIGKTIRDMATHQPEETARNQSAEAAQQAAEAAQQAAEAAQRTERLRRRNSWVDHLIDYIQTSQRNEPVLSEVRDLREEQRAGFADQSRRTTGLQSAIREGIEKAAKLAQKGDRQFAISTQEAAKMYGEAVEYERARRKGVTQDEARELAERHALSPETIRLWKKGESPTFIDESGRIRHVWPDDGLATAKEWNHLVGQYVALKLKITFESYIEGKEYRDISE